MVILFTCFAFHKETADTGLAFLNPTFLLGLTQENPNLTNPDVPHVDNEDQTMEEDPQVPVNDNDAQLVPNRRSNRVKVVAKGLVGKFVCEKRLLARAWEAYVNAICTSQALITM